MKDGTASIKNGDPTKLVTLEARSQDIGPDGSPRTLFTPIGRAHCEADIDKTSAEWRTWDSVQVQKADSLVWQGRRWHVKSRKALGKLVTLTTEGGDEVPPEPIP